MTSFSGSIEFDIAPQFGVGLDLTGYSIEDEDADISNVTLHGIYKFNQATSLGLFYSLDAVHEEEADGFGIEAAHNTSVTSLDGYLGQLDDNNGEEESIIGASFRYGLANGFSAIANIDRLSLPDDDFTSTNVAVGGAYSYQTATFFAKIGKHSISFDDGITAGSDDDNYFTFGADFVFGLSGGSTYKSRSSFTTQF